MSPDAAPEVFTSDEIARAAGVPHTAVLALMTSGKLRVIPGTRFVRMDDAVRAGRRLRADMAVAPAPGPSDLFAAAATGRSPGETALAGSRGRMPALASSLVHASLLTIAVLLTSLNATSAGTETQAVEPARLVFLVTPGPGGGGGGGGTRNPLPAPRIERRGAQHRQISVPIVTPKPAMTTARDVEAPVKPTPAAPLESRPVTREPDPLPAKVLTAPVVAAAADPRERDGVIDHARGDAESRGAGAGGGSGTGKGTGNGEGDGGGIGPGSGGGIGGGPYRPGSGIEPPRVLHEVKADYTEEARRRSLTGSVVLEIVVRRDGSVGDVKILEGLGSGLDQRAVEAVRQWRFAPARRQGAPVDVLVEVAVEFRLR